MTYLSDIKNWLNRWWGDVLLVVVVVAFIITLIALVAAIIDMLWSGWL